MGTFPFFIVRSRPARFGFRISFRLQFSSGQYSYPIVSVIAAVVMVQIWVLFLVRCYIRRLRLFSRRTLSTED